MKFKSMELIYKAVNAIASRKHDAETERRLADAIEREILATDPYVLVDQRTEISPPFPQVQAGVAAM